MFITTHASIIHPSQIWTQHTTSRLVSTGLLPAMSFSLSTTQLKDRN